jgi:hypothetical protein
MNLHIDVRTREELDRWMAEYEPTDQEVEVKLAALAQRFDHVASATINVETGEKQ